MTGGPHPKRILVVDIGGTNIKLLATGRREPRKSPSGPELTAAHMVERVLAATGDWTYDAVTIGYPGVIRNGKIAEEPVNLGRGWVDFDFAAAFGKPAQLINDAAMQALGSYDGGKMLFLGLGTGLGTSLVVDGHVIPMELGHLPYKKGRSFEDYVGVRGYEWLGKKRWRRTVYDVVMRLQAAFLVDYVVLGGGNVKKLGELPPGCRQGDNQNAFLGGFRLWDRHAER